VFAFTRCEHGFGHSQVRQGRAAALPNEVKCEDVRSEFQTLGHITGQAGTQIAGASADQDRINLVGLQAGIGHGPFSGLAGEQRSVLYETGVEIVGSQFKSLTEVIEHQVARINAVVAVENLSDDSPRVDRKLFYELRSGKEITALSLV
jgi:hypothetical protein